MLISRTTHEGVRVRSLCWGLGRSPIAHRSSPHQGRLLTPSGAPTAPASAENPETDQDAGDPVGDDHQCRQQHLHQPWQLHRPPRRKPIPYAELVGARVQQLLRHPLPQCPARPRRPQQARAVVQGPGPGTNQPRGRGEQYLAVGHTYAQVGPTPRPWGPSPGVVTTDDGPFCSPQRPHTPLRHLLLPAPSGITPGPCAACTTTFPALRTHRDSPGAGDFRRAEARGFCL